MNCIAVDWVCGRRAWSENEKPEPSMAPALYANELPVIVPGLENLSVAKPFLVLILLLGRVAGHQYILF